MSLISQTAAAGLDHQRVNSPRLARVPQQPGIIEHIMMVMNQQGDSSGGIHGL
jgi:hypothetical protein